MAVSRALTVSLRHVSPRRPSSSPRSSPTGTRRAVLKALTIFSGNANRELAQSICRYVDIPLGDAEVTRFADGEIYVESKPRTPSSARFVADLLTAAGGDRVLAIDLHAGQIQGFFNIPVDHLYGMPVLMEYMRSQFTSDAVIVSPDAGGVERARAYSKRLGGGLAIIDKRRPAPNVSEVVNIIGDVRGRDAIIVDDMVDTAGTLCAAAQAVMNQGARAVFACSTHGVLSDPAIERIMASPLKELIITDTVTPRAAVKDCPKVRVLSVARLLGEAGKRIHHGDSISSLFI